MSNTKKEVIPLWIQIFTIQFWIAPVYVPRFIYVGIPVLCFIMGFVALVTSNMPIYGYGLAALLFLYCLIILILRMVSSAGFTI